MTDLLVVIGQTPTGDNAGDVTVSVQQFCFTAREREPSGYKAGRCVF